MSKGFVSFLFLLSVAALWVGVSTPVLMGVDENPSIRLMSLRRLELETNVDAIIREELYVGILAQLPPEVIESNIHVKLLNYLEHFSELHDDTLTYEFGFSLLTQPNYLSLLSQPFVPASLEQLNLHAHVIVLPISQTIKYGEYVYTGGIFGTNVVGMKISSLHGETLFVLPINYRICVTTVQKNWPCFVGGSELHEFV